MSLCESKASNIKIKFSMISVKTSETTYTSIASITLDNNTIDVLILSLNPVDVFLRAFWRSVPAINLLLLNVCLNCLIIIFI